MDLVFLHGPAGAGKLTTARAVERLVGYPVFHNHLVVDMLTTFFPFGSPAFVRLREEFWLAVFAEAAKVGRSLTFTFTPEATVRLEEHTSELQSRQYLVCRLLLEKKYLSTPS